MIPSLNRLVARILSPSWQKSYQPSAAQAPAENFPENADAKGPGRPFLARPSRHSAATSLVRSMLAIGALVVFVNLVVYVLTLPHQRELSKDSAQNSSATDLRSIPITDAIAQQIESTSLTGPSLLSLEMRENVDFLLTPALIVQSCITEGIIVTYPED